MFGARCDVQPGFCTASYIYAAMLLQWRRPATKQPLVKLCLYHRFDIVLELEGGADSLNGHLHYNEKLFNQQTASRMARHYTVLLNSIVAQPRTSITKLHFIGEDERKQVSVGCSAAW